MKLSSIYTVIFGVPLIATKTLAQLTFGSWFGGDINCGGKVTVYTKLHRDLDCDCSNGPAVVVEGDGVVFDLNGHAVSCGDSTPDEPSSWHGVGIKVKGRSNCILGPGLVTSALTGIVLDGDGAHTVSEVAVKDMGSDGVWAKSNSNIIEKCSVEEIFFSGIYVSGDYNTVKENEVNDIGTCLETAGNGIEIEGQGNLVERNTVYDTYDKGIWIHGVESFKNRILDNTIDYINYFGMSINDGYGSHEISNNHIHGIGTEVCDLGLQLDATPAAWKSHKMKQKIVTNRPDRADRKNLNFVGANFTEADQEGVEKVTYNSTQVKEIQAKVSMEKRKKIFGWKEHQKQGGFDAEDIFPFYAGIGISITNTSDIHLIENHIDDVYGAGITTGQFLGEEFVYTLVAEKNVITYVEEGVTSILCDSCSWIRNTISDFYLAGMYDEGIFTVIKENSITYGAYETPCTAGLMLYGGYPASVFGNTLLYNMVNIDDCSGGYAAVDFNNLGYSCVEFGFCTLALCIIVSPEQT